MKFIYESNKIYIKQKDFVIAEIKFNKIDDKTYDIYSTYVDPKYRGRHLAQKLLEETYKFLKDKKYNVKATCPYANKWIQDREKRGEVK